MAALAVLLAAGCGGYEPDMKEIETDLAAAVDQQENVGSESDPLVVECPSSVKWNPGGDFHCTGDNINLIDPIRITVSMENDKGEYTWAVDEP